jgi:hypothetical protein
MAAKSTTTCLKEKAPLLLTRIRKLVAPYLLYAFIAFFHNAIKTLYVFPLTGEMSRHLTKMEQTDPSSAEYAGLSEETQHKAREVLVISIAIAVVTLMLAFAKQIAACCFAASSTTYSSSRRPTVPSSGARQKRGWRRCSGGARLWRRETGCDAACLGFAPKPAYIALVG